MGTVPATIRTHGEFQAAQTEARLQARADILGKLCTIDTGTDDYLDDFHDPLKGSQPRTTAKVRRVSQNGEDRPRFLDEIKGILDPNNSCIVERLAEAYEEIYPRAPTNDDESHDQAFARGIAESLPHVPRNLSGRRLPLDEFPTEGNKLNSEFALVILERLRQRIKRHPGFGDAGVCFENHVLFGLGTDAHLTDMQRHFILSACAIANLRAFSTFRAKAYVLQKLDQPHAIRNLLTLIAIYRRSLRDNMHSCVRREYTKLDLGPSPRLLLVGFSYAQIFIVSALAAASDGQVRVSVADVGKPGAFPWPQVALAMACRSIPNISLEAGAVPADRGSLQRGQFDFALIASAAAGFSVATGDLTFVTSREAADALHILRKSKVTTIIALANDKLWPTYLNSIYQRYADQIDVADRSFKSVVSAEDASLLLSESGLFRPAEFAAHEAHQELLGAKNFEQYYCALTNINSKVLKSGSQNGLGGANKTAPWQASKMSSSTLGKNARAAGVELEALLRRYDREIQGPNPEFLSGLEKFRHLVEEDDAWYTAHKDRYVALRGAPGEEICVASSFLEALAMGYEKWPSDVFFAGRVFRPLPPRYVTIRSI